MKKIFLILFVFLFFNINAIAVQHSVNSSTAQVNQKKPKIKSHKKTPPKKQSKKSKALPAVLPTIATLPSENSEKWSCLGKQALYISGDMRRDEILTMSWLNKTYKLPRKATTTGADRFYDAASGMDLIVIPTKAMLFSNRGGRSRVADECKTEDMVKHAALAPTQANALLQN